MKITLVRRDFKFTLVRRDFKFLFNIVWECYVEFKHVIDAFQALGMLMQTYKLQIL